jgi:prepilin-type N-terminal cleavage/methylation domain-containing protein
MISYCLRLLGVSRSGGSDRIASAGFTMIEMLIAIGMLSILFGSIYNGFVNLNRSYTTENVKAGIQQNARIGVEFMVHDIRLAGLDPLSTASAGILQATASSIRFSADANLDGDLGDPFEDIRYALNGDILEQTNHLGTETLLDSVEALEFRYFDEADPPQEIAAPVTGADLDRIRSVGISLTLQRPAGRDEPVTRTYTTQVQCRNLYE